ncbi:MAG: glycerol-3-phosphate cytidylyltransferase [Woeseiaceae bacterium]|jgi:glycerol-3-phosphate cytidylyltransferase|nr:glycerol-3-phosphate cytidylyltransferase [Woeseiaceae bacterium]MBT7275498.1 adenylyltransferase/cytidyltransferase family protein [Woeseiaceae bacterium]MDG1015682.1 adenylyltransferase/cytidyltransferase family protein [Woeseiaceae bacterium]MDG1712360.1 adenylyltransferase/cytidyltransferase family protein [Woeseiaceae bacterium]MDG1865501.1 adenylyltransferase/cytidyltransferase family protein [Woeseiaceae bacterium]|tara:strand:- start:16437 stop:16838 length:402 start_codon:yes stop_codon:yes gene_type:complete
MKIGMIAGNFDVIHMGYIYMFDECAQNCDHLICFLHDDPSKERPKKLKPIHTLSEREIMLKSLVQIKEIISYSTEAELYKLISSRSIDVRFLGDDYKNKDFTGKDLNIPIHYLDRSHGWSTTKFKKLISDSIN